MTEETETIDIRSWFNVSSFVTWEDFMPILIGALEHPKTDSTARQKVKDELMRLARCVDKSQKNKEKDR